MIAAAGELMRAPLARIVLLTGLVLLLQVPSCMIGELARERQQSRDAATEEIARTWGGRQRVAGPVLVVPYRIHGLDEKGKRFERESGAVAILPERLEIAADAKVETLERGLFENPVYRARLKLSGRFKAPGGEIGSIVPRDALRWDQARVVLQLSDVRAIDRVAPLIWAGVVREFQGGGGALGAGLHALPGVSADETYGFSIELALRGSDSLRFAPSARSTTVSLVSGWPHPRFYGTWLPDQREVRDDGFGARWAVTSIAAGLPSAWKVGAVEGQALDDAGFGVQLLAPVDPYRMSERTLKYNLLFIGLAFLVMWLIEAKTGRPVNALQYLLLGAALCLFYLLELSLAEHIGFAAAYAAAAAAVTAQVSLYAGAVLRSRRLALALGVMVAGLYALLYRLLGAEDYALLLGSASLFLVLSLVMFLTRRVESAGASGELAAAK